MRLRSSPSAIAAARKVACLPIGAWPCSCGACPASHTHAKPSIGTVTSARGALSTQLSRAEATNSVANCPGEVPRPSSHVDTPKLNPPSASTRPQVADARTCHGRGAAVRADRTLAAMPNATGTLTKNDTSSAAASSGRANGQISEGGKCCPEILGHSLKPPTQKKSDSAPTKAARPANAVRRATTLTGRSLAGTRAHRAANANGPRAFRGKFPRTAGQPFLPHLQGALDRCVMV